MKTYGEMETYLHAFLTSVLDGGEWTASRAGRFTSGETEKGTHLKRDLVGPKASPDAVADWTIGVVRFDSRRGLRIFLFTTASGLSHNEINNNKKHSLRSNIKGYGGKTHYTDSQSSDTTARSGRDLYHLQFSLQVASPETFGYPSYIESVREQRTVVPVLFLTEHHAMKAY
jgi:hypothetical protein